MPSVTLNQAPLVITQIDAKLNTYREHIAEYHVGLEPKISPLQCWAEIDKLLDQRHALTETTKDRP